MGSAKQAMFHVLGLFNRQVGTGTFCPLTKLLDMQFNREATDMTAADLSHCGMHMSLHITTEVT